MVSVLHPAVLLKSRMFKSEDWFGKEVLEREVDPFCIIPRDGPRDVEQTPSYPPATGSSGLRQKEHWDDRRK